MMASKHLPLLAVTLILFSGGCGATARAEPFVTTTDAAARQEFASARDLVARGANEEAEQRFSSFIIAHPDDPLRHQAELELGDLATARGDHDAAAAWYEQATASNDARLAAAARRRLADSLIESGRADRALEVLEPLAGRLDGEAAAELYAALVRAAEQTGDTVKLVRYLDAWCRFGGQSVCRESWARIDEIVGGLDERTLERLHDQLPRNGRGWSAATARLGILAAERGDASAATSRLSELDEAGTAEGSLVGALRAALERLERIDWSAVGVLLPLSGRTRLVGEQMRAGVSIARDEVAREGQTIRLVFRDSSGGPEAIRRAIDELVQEERVSAIIGPVESNNATVAAGRADELGVPLLVLTIRTGVTNRSRWVLRPFQTNQADVRGLVTHARDRLGLRRFAVLYPDSRYGRVLNRLVEDEVSAHGGVIEVALSFDPSQRSFAEVCSELATHEFEALVIPTSGETLELIAPFLALAGLWSVGPDTSPPQGQRGVRLFLPASAFAPDRILRARRYLQGAVFSTPFWAGDPSDRVSRFVSAYHEATGRQPSPWAAQAYDALQIVRSARQAAQARTRDGLLQALMALDGAPTVGPFSGFDEAGEPRTPLRLLRLEGETFVPADH